MTGFGLRPGSGLQRRGTWTPKMGMNVPPPRDGCDTLMSEDFQVLRAEGSVWGLSLPKCESWQPQSMSQVTHLQIHLQIILHCNIQHLQVHKKCAKEVDTLCHQSEGGMSPCAQVPRQTLLWKCLALASWPTCGFPRGATQDPYSLPSPSAPDSPCS